MLAPSTTADCASSTQVPVLLTQSTYVDDRFDWRSLEARDDDLWTDIVTESIADADLKIVADTGCFPHLEAPSEVAGLLVRFADSLS